MFDGLAQGSYSNLGLDGEVVPAYVYDGPTDTIMQSPQPDPGETYPHVNTQLFGVVDPETNDDIRHHSQQPPFNTPAIGATPDNSGFVKDFVINFRRDRGRLPTADEYRVAMGSFSPAMMPVLSTLARDFAVYDAWHAGVPSQTFCNRLFFHASTSNGYVTNHGGDSYYKWIDGPPAPTIFNRLEEAGIPWRDLLRRFAAGVADRPAAFPRPAAVLEDPFPRDGSVLRGCRERRPAGLQLHRAAHGLQSQRHAPAVGQEGAGGRRRRRRREDARSTTARCPTCVPATGSCRTFTTPSARASQSGGSNAMNTALVITFDEHGGTYDHVPPPTATPPDRSGPGEMGFTFDRLGVRVPTIVVSAYTAAGHRDPRRDAPRLGDQHALPAARARAAHPPRPERQPDLQFRSTSPSRGSPTPGRSRGRSMQGAIPEEDDAAAAATKHKHRPLTAPAQGLTGLLLARYNPGSKAPETYAEAYDAVVRYGKGLFGTYDDAG